MSFNKPHLASDWDPKKQRFPVVMLPKLDGVRQLNKDGNATGRSLKKLGNVYTNKLYSIHALHGFDGELAAAEETHPDLCRLTTSAVSTHDGEPFTLWWVFDYIHESTKDMGYWDRYTAMRNAVARLQGDPCQLPGVRHLRIVPAVVVYNMDQLEAQDAKWLAEGYEGSILRDPDGKHKDGRCTVREGAYLRIKRFVEEEAYVLGIIEGEENQNEEQVNELGRTFRSSHQENKVPNGMVGSMLCRDIKSGQEIVVGAGNMKHHERVHFFENQAQLLGKIIKYKFFPKGVKDKPRFPTYKCFRDKADMS